MRMFVPTPAFAFCAQRVSASPATCPSHRSLQTRVDQLLDQEARPTTEVENPGALKRALAIDEHLDQRAVSRLGKALAAGSSSHPSANSAHPTVRHSLAHEFDERLPGVEPYGLRPSRRRQTRTRRMARCDPHTASIASPSRVDHGASTAGRDRVRGSGIDGWTAECAV